jgi:hypothetical protein
MRDLLETTLEQLQNSELDKDSEIDRLKQFFIKFDHHVDRKLLNIMNKLVQIHDVELCATTEVV